MSDPSPSPYLAEHIKEALAAGPTAELAVAVEVVGGEVRLGGTVASTEQRAAVVDAARRHAGAMAVRDDLAVIAAGDPDVEPEVLG